MTALELTTGDLQNQDVEVIVNLSSKDLSKLGQHDWTCSCRSFRTELHRKEVRVEQPCDDTLSIWLQQTYATA